MHLKAFSWNESLILLGQKEGWPSSQEVSRPVPYHETVSLPNIR